jgi:DNA invertase Pin-like site-specific DNA recombinase
LKGQQSYKVGIYCRLSRDDETKSESASISTQKEMLTRYAQENEWEIVDYYVDDGASGLTLVRVR